MAGGEEEHFVILEFWNVYFGTFCSILCMLLLKSLFIKKAEKNRKGCFSSGSGAPA